MKENMKAKPGDQITVKVNGKPVETFIDKNGIQRFTHNKIITYLTRGNQEWFNMNALWDMVDMGMFTMDEARLIYQNNGYDLGGYLEIFEDDKIENPLEKK